MTGRSARWHTIIGGTENFEPLQDAASRNGSETWTINRNAVPSDNVLIYFTAPRRSFIATAVVAEKPWRDGSRSSEWFGHHMAKLRDIKLLPRELARVDLLKALPQWGWPKQPRKSIEIPPKFIPRLLKLLRRPVPRRALMSEISDLEGVATETTVMRRGRSQRLRNTALARAHGVCEVCRRDFSKLLAGQGVRVLQVHHRHQLSATDEPRVTRLKELSVVCANCHLLIHLDPRRAVSPDHLATLLRRKQPLSRS